jgi:hypothetical protein
MGPHPSLRDTRHLPTPTRPASQHTGAADARSAAWRTGLAVGARPRPSTAGTKPEPPGLVGPFILRCAATAAAHRARCRRPGCGRRQRARGPNPPGLVGRSGLRRAPQRRRTGLAVGGQAEAVDDGHEDAARARGRAGHRRRQQRLRDRQPVREAQRARAAGRHKHVGHALAQARLLEALRSRGAAALSRRRSQNTWAARSSARVFWKPCNAAQPHSQARALRQTGRALAQPCLPGSPAARPERGLGPVSSSTHCITRRRPT